MLKKNIFNVSAFAPASSSNISVGYDLLGFPFSKLGDSVELIFNDSKKITIGTIEGVDFLPIEPEKNTATYALIKMCQFLNLTTGITVNIKKGIPLCSGLGGSAASAVAAVTALNHCLISPLEQLQLASFAIEAESLASGEPHADNVVPCLWGELTLVRQIAPLDVLVLPMPKLYCVLIHPDTKISTQAARQALSKSLPLKKHIKQSANLASLMISLYNKDWQLLKRCCDDAVIEPQRSHLLPGFYQVKKAALDNGALSCSFSGAGPTLYALAESKEKALNIAHAMRLEFSKNHLTSHFWCTEMQSNGPIILGVNNEVA